jgi:cephalosporin-C deacetylase-like acetyl esterase
MVATHENADLLDFAKRFDYDQALPLTIDQSSSTHRDGVTVADITYAGADGERVPAYIVSPEGGGSLAAVLWGHWMMPGSAYMNRTEFLEEAVSLAKSGVLSLLIDAPMVRPPKHIARSLYQLIVSMWHF